MVTIYGPRGIGKSSLMQRAVSVLKRRGYDTHWIDLTMGSDPVETTLALLHIRSPGGRESPQHTLFEFVLGLTRPTAIAFDEVDVAADHPKGDSFFATLRRLRIMTQEKLKSSLCLFLASERPPWMFVRDVSQSPFNVGRHIHLRPLDIEGTEELLAMGSFAITPSEVTEVFRWTGGHPATVQRLALEAERPDHSLASCCLLVLIWSPTPMISATFSLLWSSRASQSRPFHDWLEGSG